MFSGLWYLHIEQDEKIYVSKEYGNKNSPIVEIMESQIV
jgi:hypothetical protein